VKSEKYRLSSHVGRALPAIAPDGGQGPPYVGGLSGQWNRFMEFAPTAVRSADPTGEMTMARARKRTFT
jgi:hypothetical protein